MRPLSLLPLMDPRILLFVLGGLGLIGVVALAKPLRRLPLSIPMLYVGLGAAAFALPLGLPVLDPVGIDLHTRATEYLTEFIVIISLAGAGLAIDRPFSFRLWRDVWPLLGVTMPLSIVCVAVLGWGWLGLTPAAALLLAAALSPTDPVLAKSVQVGPPHTADERDDVRFSLTVEAGLNDGLAFPFTYLAIAAVGQTALGAWAWEWVGVDLLYRVAVGLALGVAVGWGVAHFVFEKTEEVDEADKHADRSLPTNEGLVVMASIFLAYGVAELLGGYGFLAVFACAVAARQIESHSDYHERTHQFVNQLEEVMLVGMLIGFGGLLASGILSALTVPAAILGLLVVLVIRPLTGWLALLGCELPVPGRLAIAFLGIRGIGTIYYIAYGQDHADFTGLDLVWATASFAILVSIVIHGLTAAPLMRWLDRNEDAKADPDAPTPDEWEAEAA